METIILESIFQIIKKKFWRKKIRSANLIEKNFYLSEPKNKTIAAPFKLNGCSLNMIMQQNNITAVLG